MKEFLSSIMSQVNNIYYFRRLFPPALLARNALTMPVDYVSPGGYAHPPMAINILITARCNLDCQMCSMAPLRKRSFREMSPGDIEHIARQAAAFKPSFFIGGGEPFARRDIMDIFKAIKKFDLPLGTVSNATLITPDKARQVVDAGVDSIMFSLHGPRDVHDHITRIPGSFDKAIQNIEYFCRHKGKTNVMMNLVLSRENIDNIFDMIDLGRSLGVDRVRVEHLLFMTDRELNYHREWAKTHFHNPGEEILNVNTYLCRPETFTGIPGGLYDLLQEVRRRYGRFVFIKPHLTRDEIDRWYTEGYTSKRRCFFLWRSLFIDPQGNVFPCQTYSRMVVGNALKEPLLELWNSPKFRRMRTVIRKGLLPACARCCKI